MKLHYEQKVYSATSYELIQDKTTKLVSLFCEWALAFDQYVNCRAGIDANIESNIW